LRCEAPLFRESQSNPDPIFRAFLLNPSLAGSGPGRVSSGHVLSERRAEVL
jgi:hypothetical protein